MISGMGGMEVGHPSLSYLMTFNTIDLSVAFNTIDHGILLDQNGDGLQGVMLVHLLFPDWFFPPTMGVCVP